MPCFHARPCKVLPIFMGSAFQTFISRLISTLTLWGLCGATIYWAFEWGLWAIIHTLSLCGLYEFYKMQRAAKVAIF